MSGNKGGRPKKEIDYKTVEKLASVMCTQQEIGSFLEISVRTLQRDKEFCRFYKRGVDKGKMSIRRQQYKLLESGNATMGVWLGKQYLGQTDKQNVDHTTGGESFNPREIDAKEADKIRGEIFGDDKGGRSE